MSVWLSVFPLPDIIISETSEAIVIRFDTVTASVTRIRHASIILTFIQGHTDLNHEHYKCSIISETVQAMPIKFTVKIVRLKVTLFPHSSHLSCTFPFFVALRAVLGVKKNNYLSIRQALLVNLSCLYFLQYVKPSSVYLEREAGLF